MGHNNGKNVLVLNTEERQHVHWTA